MKVPTSTIVMALVTCVPFGLAIRDTVSGKDKPGASEDEATEMERYEAEPYAGREAYDDEDDAEDERREAVEAVSDAELATARRTLFSLERGWPGEAFVDLPFGTPMEKAQEVDFSQLEERTGTRVSIDGKATVASIEIRARRSYEGDELCEQMNEYLTGKWGESTEGRWENDERESRLVIAADGDCRLVFERVHSPKRWLSTTKLVAAETIGKPTAVLIELLGKEKLSLYEDENVTLYQWTPPGLPGGLGTTAMTARVVGDKVVSIEARVNADVDGLYDHLTSVYGEAEGEGPYVWPKARLRLEVDGSDVTLTFAER